MHLAGLRAGPGISDYIGIIGPLHSGDRVGNDPAVGNACRDRLFGRQVPDQPGTIGEESPHGRVEDHDGERI